MALSDDAIRQLTELIDSESREWAREWIATRRAVLEKRGIKASGELIASLEHTAKTSVGTAVTNIVEIAFANQGRYVEMKRLNVPGGGADYLANLAEWIQKKGLLAKYQSRFLASRKRKTVPADLLYRMAWAVAIARKTRAYRRRSWYAKAKEAGVTELYNRVAANIPDIIAAEIKAGFSTP